MNPKPKKYKTPFSRPPNKHKTKPFCSKYKLDLIILIQYHFRKLLKRKVLIIKYLQAFIRGWVTRKLFKEVKQVNNNIEKLISSIQVAVLYHATHFNYYFARKQYYKKNHDWSRRFLLLQTAIRNHFIYNYLKFILENEDWSDWYIQNLIIKKIRKPLLTSERRDTSAQKIFFRKKTNPKSKIRWIQKNIRYYYFTNCPKPVINKSGHRGNYFMTKDIKQYTIERKAKPHMNPKKNKDDEKDVIKYRIVNRHFFARKKYIQLHPLVFIQHWYKRRHKRRLGEYKLFKVPIILKPGKHSYFEKIVKSDKISDILVLQKEIKYFVYRQRANVFVFGKRYLPPGIYSKLICGKITNSAISSKWTNIIGVVMKVIKTHIWTVLKKGVESQHHVIEEDDLINFNYELDFKSNKNILNFVSFNSNDFKRRSRLIKRSSSSLKPFNESRDYSGNKSKSNSIKQLANDNDNSNDKAQIKNANSVVNRNNVSNMNTENKEDYVLVRSKSKKKTGILWNYNPNKFAKGLGKEFK